MADQQEGNSVENESQQQTEQVAATASDELVATTTDTHETAPEEKKKEVHDNGETTMREIEASKVKNERILIQFNFSKKRNMFRKPIQYTSTNPIDTYKFFASYKDPRFVDFRKEREVGVQNCAECTTTTVQTMWYRFTNDSAQVDALDSLKIETDYSSNAEYHNFVTKVAPALEEGLIQNQTLQLFKDDFEQLSKDDAPQGKKSEGLLKEFQSFSYMKGKKISSIDWQPKARGIIAFACIDPRNFVDRLNNIGKALMSYVVIWNFNDPIYPQMILEAPADVMCVKFHPSVANIIVGGLLNGQVIMWDLDSYKAPSLLDEEKLSRETNIPYLHWTQVSHIEQSHKTAVTDIQWFYEDREVLSEGKIKECAVDSVLQFYTTSADGKLLLWDTKRDKIRKNLGKKRQEKYKGEWIPFFVMQMMQLDGTKEIAATVMQLGERDTSPYAIYCCTEEGEFVTADWTPLEKKEYDDPQEKPKNPNIVKSVISNDKGGHFGPIITLQRHPVYSQLLLTAGDSCAKIWSIGCKKCIWQSPFCESQVTVARWSPTRPAVLYIGMKDGSVAVYDFLDKSNEPCALFLLTQVPITTMEFRVSTGASRYSYQYIAVGSETGTLHIVEVPRSLIKPQQDEQVIAQAYFDRERERTEYYMSRWKYHAEQQEVASQNKMVAELQQDKQAEEQEQEIDLQALKAQFLEKIKQKSLEIDIAA